MTKKITRNGKVVMSSFSEIKKSFLLKIAI
jgi:hypothetical protein